MSKRKEIRCPICNRLLFEAKECQDVLFLCPECLQSIRVSLDDSGQISINTRNISDRVLKYSEIERRLEAQNKA